ncbi:hypothetical protein HY625_02715 [Candidatus Uhrbacteria bacterium]|nr:hypothetical protein [Candidatus Uhrbacteria bacterium]
MSTISAFGKKAFTVAVVGTTIAWAVGSAALMPLAASAASSGDLIRGSLPAVYYYGSDGKRYVFPNEKTYNTWYSDFSTVKTITDSELAAIAIGGNVTYKPQAKMVKIVSSPTVYVVTNGGALRAIASEAEATALYGANWNKMIDDVPDAFFTNYSVGAALPVSTTLASLGAASTTIGADKSLVAGTTPAPVVAGALSVALATDSPASAAAPYLAGDVIFSKVTLTGTGSVTTLRVMRYGLSADADLSLIKVFNGSVQLGLSQALDANHQATFTFTTPVAVNGSVTLTLAANIAAVGTATAGNAVQLGINAASDVVLAAGSVGGTFPIKGNAITISAATIGTLTFEDGAATRNANTTVDPDNASAVDLVGGTFTAGATEDVEVTRMAVVKDGTNVPTDISSLELYDMTNAKVLATTAGWNSDFRGVFDLSASPLKITKGNSVSVQVRVPAHGVVAGSGRTLDAYFKKNGRVFEDISAVGKLYNLGIVVRDDGSGTAFVGRSLANPSLATSAEVVVTINAGSFTVLKSGSTPATGNIAPGAQNTPLLAMDVQVKGEPMRATQIIFTGVAGTTMATASVTGCTVRDTAGNAVAGPVDAVAAGAAALDGDTLTFTTTVNFPLGTNVYTLNCNIASGAAGTAAFQITPSTQTTLTGTNSGNSVTGSTSVVTGNTQTVQAAALVAVNRTTPIAASIVPGATNVPLAELGLDASNSGEDIRVTQVVYTDTVVGAGADIADWANLKLTKDDGTTLVADIGQPTGTGTGTFTFSLTTPIVVTKKTTTVVKLFGDYKSGVGVALETHTWRVGAASAVTTANISAAGVTTGTTVAPTMSPLAGGAGLATTGGQAMTYAGTGTLTTSLDSSSPTAGVVVAGKTGVVATVLKMVGANETNRVETVTFTLGGSANSADVAKAYLYDGDTKIAEGYFSASVAPTVTFDITARNFLVKNLETKRLVVKLDLNSTIAGAVSGDTMTVSLAAAGDLVAKGLSSGSTVNASVLVTGASLGIRKTIPTFTKNAGNTTTLVPGTMDYALDIYADPAADVVFRTIAVPTATQATPAADEDFLRFAVSETHASTPAAANQYLIRKRDNVVLSTRSIAPTSLNGGSMVFTFDREFRVPAGTTETVIVRLGLTGYTTTGNSFQMTLASDSSATLAAATDTTSWNDDSTTTREFNGFGLLSLPVSHAFVKP